MNKRQQLEKLGNELNNTFKQYIELAIQVEIEEQIEKTLNDLIDNLEKICNGEEIVEDLPANHKPEPTVIDMLMRYNNLFEEIETSDDEECEETELKDFLQSLEKWKGFDRAGIDFIQSLGKIGLLKK